MKIKLEITKEEFIPKIGEYLINYIFPMSELFTNNLRDLNCTPTGPGLFQYNFVCSGMSEETAPDIVQGLKERLFEEYSEAPDDAFRTCKLVELCFGRDTSDERYCVQVLFDNESGDLLAVVDNEIHLGNIFIIRA